MTKLRIHVEQFPNKNMREFHVSIPTAAKPFNRYEPDKKPTKRVLKLERALDKLPEVGHDIVSDKVRMKSIRIERNQAFDWSEVIPAVVGVLQRYYGLSGEDVTVTFQDREPWMDKNIDPISEEMY